MPGSLSYPRSVLIALDQWVNAVCLGWPDETLSSRAWRWEQAGKRAWPRKAIDAVARLLGEKGHCKASYESERTDRHLPPELRNTLSSE